MPNAYLIVPLNDQWRLGLAATSYYGLGVKMPDNYNAGHFGNVSDIKTVDLGRRWPTASTASGPSAPASPPFRAKGSGWHLPSNNQIAKTPERGWLGHGLNLGTLLELSEATRIGLSYRRRHLKLSGDAIGIDQNGRPFTDTGSLDLPLPATAELACSIS